MKTIELSQGQVALVSDHRFEELNQWKWHAHWNESAKTFYAMRNVRMGDRRTAVYMHRQIMGATRRDPLVDHIDHNGLNNQDHNLRFSTPRNNQLNRKGVQSNNTTGEYGISIIGSGKNRGYYRIQISGCDKRHDAVRKHLKDAITLRDQWVREYHQEVA